MHDTHEVENSSAHTGPPPFWRTRYGIGCLVLGAIATYYLLTEHRAHVVGALPLLILLACPLMHVFMHHGHGGHHGHHRGDAPSDTDVNKPVNSRTGGTS